MTEPATLFGRGELPQHLRDGKPRTRAEMSSGTGNTACLEAVAAGPAIAASLRAQGVEARTNADIVRLVQDGNVVAGQVVREAGRDIGDVLAACVNLINPALIVIGGSLARAGELLLAGIRESIYRRSLPLATVNLRVVQARTGARAGILGAAAMVLGHVLAPTAVDRMLR